MRPPWLEGPQRPCARCGRPTPSKAEPPLHRACKPRAAPRPPTSWAERQRRAAAVRAHVAEFGVVCPGWGRPAHLVTGRNVLTADHVRSVAQGGDEGGELQVLCRRCNSSKREKSGTVRAAPARPYSPSRMWTSVYTEPSGTC